MFPRNSPLTWSSNSRTAHPKQRSNPKGQGKDSCRKEESEEINLIALRLAEGTVWNQGTHGKKNQYERKAKREEKHRDRCGARSCVLQQHNRHDHRREWQYD